MILLKTIHQPHIPLREKKKILTKASTTYPMDLVTMVTSPILQQTKLSPTQVLCISFSFCLEFPFPKLTHGLLLPFFQITEKTSLTILYKACVVYLSPLLVFFSAQHLLSPDSTCSGNIHMQLVAISLDSIPQRA